VIGDLTMPDESGYDLVRWLRTTMGPNRDVVAVASTGRSGVSQRGVSLEAA
jgi:CheY-like chemotaxis protein